MTAVFSAGELAVQQATQIGSSSAIRWWFRSPLPLRRHRLDQRADP
jgi:hypothetical protein